MSAYADTSFLVSLYLTDTHSPHAERLVASGQAVWLTPFHVAEWTHVIEQHVFRMALSRIEADRYYEWFEQHRERGLWLEAVLPDAVFDVCARLARRYAAKLGLLTLDTLHVAVTRELKAERFWTFDERQKKLARAVGPKTN